MADERQVFVTSERFLRTRRRRMVLPPITAMVVLLLVVAYATKFGLERVSQFAIHMAIGLVIPVLVIFFMIRQFRQMKLHLGPDGLVLEAGATSQRIAWSDITKVQAPQTSSGKPRFVKIFTTGRRPLLLFGFEQVDEIVRVVQAKLPSTVQVETKQIWQKNLFTSIALIATVLVITLASRIAGQTVSEVIDLVFVLVLQLAVGILFLAYGPISRVFPRSRKWEIGLGVFFLVVALVLVYEFFT